MEEEKWVPTDQKHIDFFLSVIESHDDIVKWTFLVDLSVKVQIKKFLNACHKSIH